MTTPTKKMTRAKKNSGSALVFNVLTVLMLLLTCLSATSTGALVAFPGALAAVGLAPAVATAPALPTMIVVQGPSATPNPDGSTPLPSGETPAPVDSTATSGGNAAFPTFPPTWTPSATPTASEIPPTRTPQPSATETLPPLTETLTPTPSLTPTVTKPGPTPTRTKPAIIYRMKTGHPLYLANYANSAGCSWMGIFGQVFDAGGLPVNNLKIHVEGRGINVDVLTGSALQYGGGYYEAPLGNVAVATTNEYRIQVRNSANQPLSDFYYVNTKSTCTQNLILVSFETKP